MEARGDRLVRRCLAGLALAAIVLTFLLVNTKKSKVIRLADGQVRERVSVFGFDLSDRSVDCFLGSVVMPADFVSRVGERELLLYSWRIWDGGSIPSSYANRFYAESVMLREVLAFRGASESEVQEAWKVAVDRAERRESISDFVEKFVKDP